MTGSSDATPPLPGLHDPAQLPNGNGRCSCGQDWHDRQAFDTHKAAGGYVVPDRRTRIYTATPYTAHPFQPPQDRTGMDHKFGLKHRVGGFNYQRGLLKLAL